MKIPLATDLKTRVGDTTKDARLKNAYVEVRGEQSVVRHRPSARGGVAVGSGVAQGGYGTVLFWGDTAYTISDSTGTTWDSGTNYFIGDHASVGFVDYWALTDNIGSSPASSPSDWSISFVPPLPYSPYRWSPKTIDSSHSWTGIAYGNGTYCAVGITYPAISTTGASWTTGSALGDNYLINIEFLNGLFIATGYRNYTGGSIGLSATSSDGVTWNTGTISNTALSSFIPSKPVFDGFNYYVAMLEYTAPSTYNTSIYSSADGLTWSKIATITGLVRQAFGYGGGKFVITASSSVAYYSSDAINWSTTTIASANYTDIVYSQGKFVSSSTTGAAYSSDGIAWNFSTYARFDKIAASGSFFVAIRTNSVFSYYSSDGITWAFAYMPSSAAWTAVASNGSDFCAIASNSTTAATSP